MATKGYLIDTNAGIDYLAEAISEKGLTFLDGIIDDEYSISVISRNFKDFMNISGLLVVNPHNL